MDSQFHNPPPTRPPTGARSANFPPTEDITYPILGGTLPMRPAHLEIDIHGLLALACLILITPFFPVYVTSAYAFLTRERIRP